jgi:hypothetical protein
VTHLWSVCVTSYAPAPAARPRPKQIPLDGPIDLSFFWFGPVRQQESVTMSEKEQGHSEPVWNVDEFLERVDNDQVLLRELLTIFKEDF